MKNTFCLLLLVLALGLMHHPSDLFAYGGGPFFGKGMKGQSFGAERKSNGPDPEVMGAFVPGRANRAAMERRGFIETGLVPRYPENFDCPKAGSLFASPYRADGSRRTERFFEGLHGGLDIAQPEGTPLVAMADGEVILNHGGVDGGIGGIGGIGLWLRHDPEDTGLDKHVFIEYKHLREMPALEPGDRVKMGQVVAHTGNTGTTGGHYGSAGFHHLHLTAYWSDGPGFKAKRVLIPLGGQWLDPLAFLRGGPFDSRHVSALPQAQKEVGIPFMTDDGQVHPEGARVIWPYVCMPR